MVSDVKKRKKVYSYIRYPHARNGVLCVVLGGIALLVTIAVCVLSVINNGNTALSTASWGFFAIVLSVMGIWFAVLALFEQDKNYLLAGIGGGISLLTLLCWILMMVNG